MVCIFCDILSGKRDAHKLYEDDTHLVFLDKYPIDDGHLRIICDHHVFLIGFHKKYMP